MNRIHLCLARMSGQELRYIQDAFDTHWVAPMGGNVDGFEDDLMHLLHTDKEVVALSSGTAAIHLALAACGVGPGDEVMVQSFTFCATANPVRYLGGVPVFVDSEPDSWNMDADLLDAAIADRIAQTGRKPRAIVPVSLYGMPYQVDRIVAVGHKYGIAVVEDTAESLGSCYDGVPLGLAGDYGVLSFNGNKMITTSGGGALICPDLEAKQRIRWLASQAREAFPYYQHEVLGYNYRMSNVCAGIGRGQITVVHDHIAHHRRLCSLYEQLLRPVEGISVHVNPSARYDSNYWLTTITLAPDLQVWGGSSASCPAPDGAAAGVTVVDASVDSGGVSVVRPSAVGHTDFEPNPNVEALRLLLDKAGVESRPLWKPMHRQPLYAGSPAYLNGVSDRLFRMGLCLPSGPCVSEDDVRYIVSLILEAVRA